MPGCTALLGGDLFDVANQVEVMGEVIAMEARVVAPKVVFRQVLKALEAAGEKTAAERAVGNELDPELTHGRHVRHRHEITVAHQPGSGQNGTAGRPAASVSNR